jgi:hypothetical protein
MPRSQGVDTNPNNTARVIGLYSNSLTYQGFSAGRGGGTPPNVTTTKDYRLFANYQNGSSTLKVGPSGLDTTVATKSANGRWQVTQAAGGTDAERKALQDSLNAGQFGKKLNTELETVARRDLGNDQYDRKFNPSTARVSEEGSTPGGGANGAGGNSGGSSFSATPQEQKQYIDRISQGVESRTKYEKNLIYPEKYDGNDYLTIEMIRYIPNKNLGLGGITGDENSGSVLNSGLKLQTFGERANDSKESPIATFTLPIPSNLTDANPVNWTEDPLDPLKAYGAGAIGRFLGGENIFKSAESEGRRAAAALKANADAAKTVLNASIINQILGANTLTRSTGAVVNQNTELLFKGVALRSFVFSFKMTPRSKKEADIVRKIIRGLKQGMSVKRTVDGIFLASPNVFKLQFWYVPPKPDNGTIKGGTPKEHPFLPKLKPCALTNISVNYMPDGSYMTYGDGSMVSYDMTLAFSEIDPIFDDDYEKLDKNNDEVIGY